jgi:aminoglycoside 6'-N-acetyltransferase I
MAEIKEIHSIDLPACAKLYVHSFNCEPWNDHWTYKTALGRLQDIYKAPRFYGIQYVETNCLLGAILGNIEVWYEDYHYQLKEMYVDPKVQRSGIGTGLLNRLKQGLLSRKVKGIYLHTSSAKWTEAFYKRNGFIRMNDMVMMTVGL